MLCITRFEDIARRQGSRWLGREKTLNKNTITDTLGRKKQHQLYSYSVEWNDRKSRTFTCKLSRSGEKFNYYYHRQFKMSYLTCINQVDNIQITNSIYEVFYELHSHQNVLAAIATIFMIKLLLQKYKSINVLRHVVVIP
jgi:hypothetical protein